MTQWGYGSYSAQETQKLARLPRKAGAIGGYLSDLAALGTHGENPKNISTELMELIRKVLGACHHSDIRGADAYVRGKKKQKRGSHRPNLVPMGCFSRIFGFLVLS